MKTLTTTSLLGFLLLAGSAVRAAGGEFAPLAPASALEFGVGSNFDLQTFEGSFISYKRIGSERSGWRLGLSPLIATSRESREQPPLLEEWEQDRYGLDVTWQYLALGRVRERTRFFWGLGPLAGFGYREFRRSRSGPDFDDFTDSDIEREWRFGLTASVGVEWFATRTLSFMGEYTLDAYFSVLNESGPQKIERHSWILSGNGARLGLAVAF